MSVTLKVKRGGKIVSRCPIYLRGGDFYRAVRWALPSQRGNFNVAWGYSYVSLRLMRRAVAPENA